MSVRDYAAILRRRWLVFTVTLIGCLGVALGYTLATTPVYRAQTSSFVTMGTGDGSGTLLQGSQFTLQRVKSYTDVISSPEVLQRVINDLDLDMSMGELRGRIDAVNPSDTVLINISVTHPDPALAADIADAVTLRFARTIEQLEMPRDGGSSPVKVTMIVPATEPSAPISPRMGLNLVLAAVLGAAAGFGLALLREQFDTSVRTPEDVSALTGSAPLGQVMVDPQASKQPLVVLDPENPRAEAFRTIRANLQFVDVDRPPRRFVVTSAVPGEGKTTTACNLAITMVQAGYRVCLVDGDLRRPRVADTLGLEGAVGLSNVLAGQYSVYDAIMHWKGGTLSVLPAGTCPPNPSDLMGSQQMVDLLDELSANYDIVIIDSPPLLPVSDAVMVAQATDGAVLVVRHGETNREQVLGAYNALRTVGATVIGTVLTFVPKGRRQSYQSYTPDPPPERARNRGRRRAQQPAVPADPSPEGGDAGPHVNLLPEHVPPPPSVAPAPTAGVTLLPTAAPADEHAAYPRTVEQHAVHHEVADHVPLQQTPFDHAPIEQAPFGHAPVDHVPVDHAPVDQAPFDHPPVHHGPTDHAPTDHALTDHSPVVPGTDDQGHTHHGGAGGLLPQDAPAATPHPAPAGTTVDGSLGSLLAGQDSSTAVPGPAAAVEVPAADGPALDGSALDGSGAADADAAGVPFADPRGPQSLQEQLLGHEPESPRYRP